MFQIVIDITITGVTSFVESFKEMRNIMCDKRAGSKLNCVPEPAGSQSILKEHHATGNASTDGWIQFARVISTLFAFLIKIYMEVIIPIMLCTIAFLLDVLVMIIQLFKFLIVQGAGLLSRLLGFALKNLANMNIDSKPYVPEQDALAFINDPPVTFLENSPGPPFIKTLLLRALTIIKEYVRAAFYAVVGFILLVDKTFCMIFWTEQQRSAEMPLFLVITLWRMVSVQYPACLNLANAHTAQCNQICQFTLLCELALVTHWYQIPLITLLQLLVKQRRKR